MPIIPGRRWDLRVRVAPIAQSFEVIMYCGPAVLRVELKRIFGEFLQGFEVLHESGGQFSAWITLTQGSEFELELNGFQASSPDEVAFRIEAITQLHVAAEVMTAREHVSDFDQTIRDLDGEVRD